MILYFSGSGNSLAIARKLAEKLNEQVVPLHEAVSLDLSKERRIGLVYPTYWLDAAKPVRDLVPKLNISPSAYVFIVITCGAQTNNAVWSVRKLLAKKDVKVAYCNKIRVPDSSALGFGRDPNKQLWKFDKYAPRLEQIIKDLIAERRGSHFGGCDPLGWLLNRPGIAEKTQKVTQPATNAEKCIGCGTCAKICPQENITMVDGKANIGGKCAMCLACLHFCPHQAMELNHKPTLKEQQYHHPDIQLKNMMTSRP